MPSFKSWSILYSTRSESCLSQLPLHYIKWQLTTVQRLKHVLSKCPAICASDWVLYCIMKLKLPLTTASIPMSIMARYAKRNWRTQNTMWYWCYSMKLNHRHHAHTPLICQHALANQRPSYNTGVFACMPLHIWSLSHCWPINYEAAIPSTPCYYSAYAIDYIVRMCHIAHWFMH